MARPIRNNAEYFTHLASLRDDRRIKAIRARFGAAGYGILIMLLETMTNADFTQISTDDLELELLAGDFGVSVTEIDSLIQIALKVGYFCRNEAGMLVCPDLNKALESVFEKRNRSRNVASGVKNYVSEPEIPVSVTENPQAVAESTQNKVKESKVKESKGITVIDVVERENENFQPQQPPSASQTPPNPPLDFSDSRYFEYRDEIKKQQRFRESCIMGIKVPADRLDALIDEFTLDVRGRELTYKSLKDFRDHCMNFMRKKVEAGTFNPPAQSSARQTPRLNSGNNNTRAKAGSGPYGQGADLTGIVYEQESW